MKEKPSHHPKREIRAHQTRFGGTEEQLIKYESDPRTVNFISILPLIQKEPGSGRDIIGKISMPAFQIIYPIVKLTYETVPTSLGVSEKRSTETKSCKRIVIPSYFLRVMLVFVRGVGAVCVYDQPGDETTLVKQMVSDRSKLGVYR
ncbi:hypothetical protein F2Q69_00012921 [Brassica cretica]|uniref:Uncharacterized protein n=1 Tax=Brassica cretica TaxID=69181 RepID=A0A8S9QR55_BRACR|nr:hypothetical protein F2Q69_00012921 [Brassica cretica]